MINIMIKVKFGIGVRNTIFSETLLESERANFLLIQKYLSLVDIIFMATAVKTEMAKFISKNNLFTQKMEKILNLTAFRRSLRNSG
jgi:alpha-D-ribose 1-methylphosphonate 5-triphosphate synthase subunit PhnI